MSKSARRHRKQQAGVRRRRRRERAAVKYRAGRVPLAQQRIPGLWWVDDRQGWFRRVRPQHANAVEALNADTRLTVWLVPSTLDETFEAILRYDEEVPF